MNKKPFFRSLDRCWYAQPLVGASRKQIKLKFPNGEIIRGKENEAAAWTAFHKLLADDPATMPKESVLRVADLCDKFLEMICPYVTPPAKKPKKLEAEPPL